MDIVLQQHIFKAYHFSDLSTLKHRPRVPGAKLACKSTNFDCKSNASRVCINGGNRGGRVAQAKGLFPSKASFSLEAQLEQEARHREPDEGGISRRLSRLTRTGLACALSFAVAYSSSAGGLDSGILFSELQTQRDNYEIQVSKHKPRAKSQLPSADEAEAMLQFDRDLFTDDAWDGMKYILDYARYVDSLQDVEEAPGCEQCTRNRELLEKGWQTVANEFYDPRTTFSQAQWAQQLLQTLQDAGGCLRTKREAHAALQAMVATLGDRYTEFLTPDRFRFALRKPMPAEREYLAAQFTGTGLQISKRSPAGGWVVEGLLAESPAEEAGIQPGERIVEIDYYSTEKLTASDVTALLRGPSGSVVYLRVAGPEKGSPIRDVDLERRPIPQPPVKLATLSTPLGLMSYVRLHYFSSGSTRALAAALRQGEAQGHLGTIIDLRNNPGGVFEEAILSASFFLPPGTQIVETVRNGFVIDNVFESGDLPRQMFPSQPGVLSDRPVAILVNSGSASASEVFAGALHDNHRAVLVGQQTFGKGLVQYFFPMGDGSGLKITVFKYLTPSGYDISLRGGIKPDKVCHDFPHAGPPSPDADSCLALATSLIAQSPEAR